VPAEALEDATRHQKIGILPMLEQDKRLSSGRIWYRIGVGKETGTAHPDYPMIWIAILATQIK